jgi:uncharacterized repeat protein (TIGR02543 family)
MRLPVKKGYKHGFGAPRKFISSVASWLVVAPLLSLISLTTTATSANAVSANPIPVCSGANCTVTFPYTGDYYAWTVPSGITAVTVDVQGAQGSSGGAAAGLGGRVQGSLAVTAGATYYIYVGGQNGFNGGGNKSSLGGGQGGGASDIRTTANSVYSDRIVVAGGGGGSGSLGSGSGGAGGGLTGGSGGGRAIAGGGSQSSGGAGGSAGLAGSFGVGGAAEACGGAGGGGGGWYGGGGGGTDHPNYCDNDDDGGGGGSSFTSASLVSNVSHTQGFKTGNGQVIITYQQWTLVYQTTTPVRNGSGEIVYTAGYGKAANDVAANLISSGQNFTRVRYRMEVNYSGTLRYADVSFDKWSTATISNLAIPDMVDQRSVKTNVSNLIIDSNWPGFTNVATAVVNGTGKSGRIELWNYNYSPAISLNLASPGLGNVYDSDDTPEGLNNYGSFQVHNLTDSQTVLAWNRHFEASPDIGFGSYLGSTNTDWTFARSTNFDTSTWKLQIYIDSPSATAPNAPTIGTAEAMSSTSASVPFSAPASNGGATITTYTATSTPGGLTGTVSQSGSGAITVNGLTPDTNYTFTVTATNSAGTSTPSSASNSIKTPTVAPTINSWTINYDSATASRALNVTASLSTGVRNTWYWQMDIVSGSGCNDPDGGNGTGSASASSGTLKVSGLTNSCTYTFRLANWNGTVSAYTSTTISVNTYTVTYDSNSSTSGTLPTLQMQNIGTTITVQANSGTLARTGYTFGGWNTSANGSGTNYTAGTGTFTLSVDTTLYANWTANTNNAITWNDQSATTASSGGSTSYTTDQPIAQIRTTPPVRTGYTFGGWWTQINGGGVQVTDGSFTPPSPYGTVTLYAKWIEDIYTVNYQYNGADGGETPASSTYIFGGTAITLPTPTRTGYTFGGQGSIVTNGLALQYDVNTGYSGSGTTITDARGNSNGTIVNNPSFTASNGGYFTLVGSNSQYIITNASLTSTMTSRPSTSIFMWAFPTANNGILISEFGDASIGSGWHDSQIEMVNGVLKFRVWDCSIATSAIATPLNNWYYVGFTYNFATSTLIGYVNGQVAATVSGCSRSQPTNLHFGIGAADSTNMGSGAYGNFRFGSLHVYTGALTATQVQQNYDAGCSRFGLCGGWYSDPGLTTRVGAAGTSYTPSGAASSITLYAKWTANQNTVTFKSNFTGGVADTTQSITTDVSTSLTANSFSRSGYTFAGWNTQADGNGTSYSNSQAVTINGSLMLYAQWTANTYTVTYNYNSADAGNSVASDTFTSGGTFITLPTPTRIGYTFGGWYSNVGLTSLIGAAGASYSPTGTTTSLTAYAKWTLNTYAVTFKSNFTGGAADTTQTVGHNVATALTANVFTRTGNTFAGWNTAADGSGTDYSNSQVVSITGPLTLFAKWNLNSYTITFKSNFTGGASDATQSVNYNVASALTPNTFTRTGYTFAGWNSAADGTGTNYTNSQSVTLTSALTLHARWTGNLNTLTFNSQGGSTVSSQSWTTGSALNLATPTRAGYTFNGWFDQAVGGTQIASSGQGINVQTFYCSSYGAQPPRPCTANPYSETTATQIYFQWGGGAVMGTPYSERVEVKFSGFIMSPTTKTITFLSDGDDGDYLDFNGVNVISNWRDKGSGSARSASITLQAGTYYPFTYWFYENGGGAWTALYWNDGSGDVLVPASAFFTGAGSSFAPETTNVTLFAQWTPINNTVTFNSQSGSAVNSWTWATGSSLTLPAAPIRAGYTFTGWFDASTLGNKVGDAGDGISPTNTASFTLFARWSANTNVVTFDTRGGSSVADGSFITAGSLTLPASPTLSGATFAGWFLALTGGSALPTTYSPVATSALTIYARWTRTLSIDASSFQPGYARTGSTPPTLTATSSAGVGVGALTFTSLTPSTCSINATSGLVAFVNTGTCTISAAIAESGGFSAASATSVSFAIRSAPASPTALIATPGAGQITISWSAPTDTGGGISSYIVTATPGGATCTWTSGPLNCVVSGLTNGTSYLFTVASVNSQGSSASSVAVSATPRTVPGAPTISLVSQISGSATSQLVNMSGVVGYWNFDDSSNLAVNRVSGSALSVVGATYTASGKNGGGLSLAGSQYLTGTVTNLPVGASHYSIGGWFRTTSTGSQGILGWGSWGSGSRTNALRTDGNTGFYNYWWSNDLYGSYNIPTNTWIHIIATYDGTANRLYVNGTQIASRNPGTPNSDNSNFRIGTTNTSEWFYGTLDDIVIFNRALTVSEINEVKELTGVASVMATAASIAFTAPTSTGGSTITGYTVTASNGATATGLISPIAFTGLSLGVPYTFTVTATNAAGTSVASAPSTSITLRGSPGTSTAPSAAVTSSGISLVWAAPSGNGGMISDYTIQYSTNSGSNWTTYIDETSSTTAAVIRGLTLGTSYTFRVAAISEQGTGQFSPASAAVIPAGMPEAPGKPTGSASGNSITVSWAAAVNNGSPITNYTLSYSSDSGNTWTTVARLASTATSATVSNLTVAQTYIFRVFATNALGISGNSETSNPIAIGTAPLAPTTLVAEVDGTTSTSAVLSWKKPSGALGVVEAKTTVDSTSFTAGLLGRRYVGYYNDDVNFFTNNRLFATTGTPVNSTSIFNFSSNSDLYSWMWTGFFKAPVSGVYRFYLSSDDASHLWIGDVATTGFTTSNATVNNGGLHPTITRTGSINLFADQFYPIRVMFGENYGGDIVSLFWDLPNGTRVTNGTGYFFQSPTGAVAAPVSGCAATVGNSAGVQISKEGNNCIVRFTNPGVTTWSAPTGVSAVDVLVVGGGGGAGFDAAGGGGGGAVVERLGQSVTPGSSYSIAVGAGGATSQSVGGQAQDGGSSTFGTITAVGGGGGGSKNANGRGVIGAGGGGGGHANPGNNGVTLGGTPSSGADSFWGWSASNSSMVNNQGSVAQFSYIQASLTRTIPITLDSAITNVTFNVNVDNSITNIIGWQGERIDTYSIRVELLNSSGTVIAQNSFSGSQKHGVTARPVSVTNSDGTLRNLSVRITVTGFDAGYWAGFYGPIFSSPSLTVNGTQFPAPGSISGFGGGGANGARAVGNGGGGGGAGGIGGSSATSAGGVGVLSTLTNTFYGGGGGGGSWNGTGGPGGTGGGGTGGNGGGAICGNDGAPNTGGGGGAMGNAVCSNRTLGAGGSGVVVLRYAAANTNIELPAPDDYIVQYADISAASAPDLITNGLVLQYEANTYSGSGSTLTDARGNSNGTLMNNPAYTATGGGYFTMIGSSSHYIITNSPLDSRFTSQPNRTTTSIFMWVYPTSANGILISEFGTADINSGWHDSQIEMVNGTMRFRVWNGANLASAIATPVNNWYYVGFVYNQATQTLTGYVNGQVAVTGTNYARQAPYDYNANLHFGIAARDTTNLGSGAHGSFRFGSLHVYNSALTTAQVQQNFAAGCARFALCDASIYQNYQTYSWQTFVDAVSPLEKATVTDLVPGKRYIFRVASKNGVGTGSFTAATNPLEIRGAPGTAPALGTITAGNQRAVVTFTAPTNTGGSPIIRYTARAAATGTPALPARSCTWSTGALSCTINELVNGRTYDVTVTAANTFGESQPSSALTVTPKTIPDAPTAITVTSGSTQLALSWTAPAFDGGSPITGYKIERSTVDAPTWVVVTANTGSANTTATVTSLTNGTVYRIRITAINLVGESVPSEIATGTPRGVATASTAPIGNGNNASAFITWSAPANNGSPITDYEVQFGTSASGPWSTFVDAVSSVTGATVTGLTNGTAYFFQVRAINGAGTGAWSPSSAAITPATIPGAPTLTAVTIPTTNPSGRLALAFTAGTTGGSPITGYEFSINGGATWSALTGTSNLIIEGLTNGVSYTVSLRAVNAQGVGPASNEIAAAPTGPADAPVISGIVPENQKITLSFSAPANNGGSAITGYRYQIRNFSSPVWSAWTVVSAQPLVITSLTNGVTYSVKLQAINAGGTTAPGAESAPVSAVPFTNPSAPTITSVTPGNGSLAIAYTVDTNGSAITATEYSLDAGTTWIRTNASTSPLTITGLVNGTSYTPQLRLINGAGEGGATSAAATIPFREPFAPAITSVSSTSNSITMNFTINNGGSAITTVAYRSRSVAAPGITSCAAAYGTLTWSENWSAWTEIPAATSLTLSGLSTGNCYDVQVRAQNSAGYGPSSRESGKPVTAPSAPSIVSITPAAGALAVTFNESADNGGAAISAYEYRIGSGSWISLATLQGFTLGSSTVVTLPSLTNGTSYSITLRALNSAGASAPSSALTGTPVTTPSAPTISSVAPLDGALRIAFAAPTSTGGSAILGYQYQLTVGTTPGAWTNAVISSGASTFDINGLSNSTTYSVSLRALNAQGNSATHTFATAIAPGKAPDAPSISAIIVGNQRLSIVVAPGLDGGWPLTNYDYSIDNGATWVRLTGAPELALANPIIVTGLTNGTSYQIRVRTVNGIGDSPASVAVTQTPATTPSAPEILSVSSGDGSLSVAFASPTAIGGSTGGSAITNYQYSVNGGVNWFNRQTGGTASPLVITGLTNGVAYNVMIRAVNAIGVGEASNAVEKFPQVPGAGRPISITTTPLDGGVRVAWTPPAAYIGAPIAGYRVNVTPGTGSCLWSTGEYNCTITGLTNGTSYTFTVTSQRTEGGNLVDIDTSVASATTVPRTFAGAPTALAAVGGGNEAALSWIAPTNNGGAAITDYRIEFSSDGGATWSAYSDAISAETSATVDGLSPGTQYRFRVAAINAAGVGGFSTASTSTKTFERAPELTLTLDQQSADGFAFIMRFKDAVTGGTDPLLYTLAATTNNPGATVEQVGDFFTVRGLTPGASVTVTVTAQRADYLQAVATIFSSALLATPAPTLGAAEAIDGGFRVTINNYAANTTAGFSYAVTSSAGAVIDDGAGVYRIVGLANGESALATVTASRTGYATVSTSLSGSALALGVAAQIENITGTRNGFTFTIANYTPEATYTFTSSKVGSTVTRTNELMTVTGLTNLEMATITVKTVRTGYMDASIDVVGVALPQSEVNTLASLSLSTGVVAFNASTYEYQLNVANTVTTYRVTPTKSDQDSTIAVSINGGGATPIASGAESAALPLNVGVNTIVVAVTSQVGSVQNYTLYINRAKSSVSSLSALSLSAGTITGFDSSLMTYDANVLYGSSSITATATSTNNGATLRIQINGGAFSSITSAVASGGLALNVGNNLVRIEVTSEDGLSVTSYEVTVTRAGAANSQLGSLAISVGNMPTFSPSTLNYEVIVPTGTTSARVTPTLGSTVTGSISVNGVELADGAQSQEIALTSGTTNQITIVVTASDGSSTPYLINVKVDAPPVALALTRPGVGTQSNVVFSVQPQISINDALSNRVLLNTSTVNVAITSGTGGQLIGGTSATAVRGLATFSGLGLRGVAGTTYTLTYSSGALTVATQQITLTPGDAVALAFRAGSATVASGAGLATPLQVAAVDSDGNTVSNYGSAITVAISAGATLGGTTVRTPIDGLATYSDLTLRGTVNPSYTITATSGNLTSATREVAMTFGAASTLAVTRATAGVVSGATFTTQPQLTIRDSAGNTVTTATGEISISIANGVGGTLTGTTTVSAVNGVANFTNLTLSGIAGTAYTVSYSATGLTSATETLSVSAGAATRLQLATLAAGFNNGTAFTRAQPILRIQDATGNTVTSSTAAVTVTVSNSGVLLGTTSVSAAAGIVSFTNLGIFGVPGSPYTLTFASPGLASVTQTILLTSGASLVPSFAAPTPTFDGFTVQITNYSRIFNWTFSVLDGPENAQISLGSNGLITVSGMPVGSSATISATTARSGFENGAATVMGSTLLAPLRPIFSATTSTATGFRAQVTNFDSSYAWGISASNGGTATISSTGIINVTDLAAGISSDVTVTTTKAGRVSASATVTGTAIGAESVSANTDISSNLLTAQTLSPLCAGGSSDKEGISNINDRNSKSKYLCFNASSRLNASYIRNSAGFYTGDLGSKVVTGIQFTSGDSDRARDPIIYTLFGCNGLNSDCVPIVVNGRTGIDVLRNSTGSAQTFLNKNAYNFYKVTFGALRTSWTDAAQVAEVALIGTDALAAGRTPTFGAITRTATGYTVPITNFSTLFTWRVSTNLGGAAIGSDGVVTVTGLPSATTATLTVNTSRAKYEDGIAATTGTSLSAALIPTFGTATPTADGFTVPITNYSADYAWSVEAAAGAATITADVLTVTGQSGENQPGATVITNRANYASGRAQVVASALAVGLTPTFGPSISRVDGFTIQITNYSPEVIWNVQTSSGAAVISSTGLISVTGLNPGASATVNVTTSKVGALTVIAQTTGKSLIGAALIPRFGLSVSSTNGFTAQILNYDSNYSWSGTAGTGESVSISNTGLVAVSGVTTGRMTTATISAARNGYGTGSQTISGTAVAPAVDAVGGQDIQLQVPMSATTAPNEVIVTIDIPVDAAPGSTQFTGSAVATDAVDQGLRTVKIAGTNSGSTVTSVSAPIAITIPASAGIGIPVYSPDGLNWLELPLLASPNLPDGQEMGFYRYDDGTIVILTRKIGG